MKMTREVKIDDWIETEHGIGKVLSLHNCYVEKYSPSFLEGEKKLNDLDCVICKYKLFMNFDGSVRKRNMVLSSNASYCAQLSDEYKGLLNQAIKANENNYEKFLAFKPTKSKPVIVELFFRNKKSTDLELLKKQVTEINNDLQKPFIFDDFEHLLLNKAETIKLQDANKNPDLQPPDYIIRLYNNEYSRSGKNLLFEKVDFTINEWRKHIAKALTE